jgi:hypothetical protein
MTVRVLLTVAAAAMWPATAVAQRAPPAASITASPNPVAAGSGTGVTTVNWTTGDYGIDHVALNAFDVSAPAPSGATFTIESGGRPVRVLFAPSVERASTSDTSASVIFEVRFGAASLYRGLVNASAPLEAIAVEVPAIPGQTRTEISFLTRTPSGRGTDASATWRRLRFLSGPTALAGSRPSPVSHP